MDRRLLFALALLSLILVTVIVFRPVDNEAGSGIRSAPTSAEGEAGKRVAPGQPDPVLLDSQSKAGYPGMPKADPEAKPEPKPEPEAKK